jgi:hypothetical protein
MKDKPLMLEEKKKYMELKEKKKTKGKLSDESADELEFMMIRDKKSANKVDALNS